MRLLSAEAQVALHHMRSGQMSEADWAKLANKMGAVSEAPFFIDDSPNMTLMEIRAKCRRLKQRHNLQLVVVDYLQLMSSGKRVESRQQEVSEFSRSLKLLAKELEVPVIAISQLNRGPEQRQDKRPMLSDLRESGSLEQDADMVVLLHREDAYDRESPRAGEADFIVAKHRNGPTATINVAFQGHYSRFVVHGARLNLVRLPLGGYMRILHTSDWHLGRTFLSESMHSHQEVFVDWLLELVAIERLNLLLLQVTSTTGRSHPQSLFDSLIGH